MLAASLAKAIDSRLFARTESFEGAKAGVVAVAPAASGASVVAVIIVLALYFAALLAVGKYLWNAALVPLIPAVRPAESVWQVLGVALLAAIVLPK